MTKQFDRYKVYTMTQKNNFSLKYSGDNEIDALNAYDVLVSKNKVRCFQELSLVSNSVLAVNRMRSEDFPE
jgi:hypothetical protein